MEPHPETPPGTDRPGVRELLARVAVDTRPLRDSRPFRWLWLGQMVSYVGSQVVAVAVPFQMYELTGSTLAVALVSLAELLPLLTLTLVGGSIADAVDRRSLLLVTESRSRGHRDRLRRQRVARRAEGLGAVRARLRGGVVLLPRGRRDALLTPHLVPPEQLAGGGGAERHLLNFGAVAGPAIGGILIAAIGLPLTYALDVVSFGASLLSVFALPRIPASPDAERPGLRSVIQGFRYLKDQRVVLGSFLVDANAMVFGMPSALFPALAAERFGGGAQTVGYCTRAPYAGALVARSLSGWTGHVRRQGLAVLVAAAAWGAAIAAFGFAESRRLSLVLLAVAGAADDLSATSGVRSCSGDDGDRCAGGSAGIEFAQVASGPRSGTPRRASSPR